MKTSFVCSLAALSLWTLLSTVDVAEAANARRSASPVAFVKKPSLARKVDKKVVEPTDINVGGAKAAAPANTGGNLIVWGDIGNLLTAILSFVLLQWTPFNVEPCPLGSCEAIIGTGESAAPYDGPLDSCYVCDGFCISDPTSNIWNSHMLSFYSDLIMTVPLLLLRQYRSAEIESLGLDDFYLSSLKVWSVTGHGVAHLALSILTLTGMDTEVLQGQNPQRIVSALLAITRFGNQNFLDTIAARWDQLRGNTVDTKQLNEDSKKLRKDGLLRGRIAPLLSGVSLAQMIENPLTEEPSLFNYLLFGLTCFIFFEAGIPQEEGNWWYGLLMTAITTYIAVGVLNVASVQQSFVVVFTSAYLVSTLYQVAFWNKDEKNAFPFPYAVTAWTSNLVTTLVGWALGLFCSPLKDIGGHVLYDLSIPLSYFAIYFLSKNNAEGK